MSAVRARVACLALSEVVNTDDTRKDLRLQCEETLNKEPNAKCLRRLKLDMASHVNHKESFLSLYTLANSIKTHHNLVGLDNQVDYWT